MKFSGQVIVDFRSKYAKGQTNALRRDLIEYIGVTAEGIAKANVAPGKGPGPHPHSGRVDTGKLRDSIAVVIEDSGDETDASLICTLDYGLFLEIGTAKMPRYPWLYPAAQEAGKQYGQEAKRIARVLGF